MIILPIIYIIISYSFRTLAVLGISVITNKLNQYRASCTKVTFLCTDKYYNYISPIFIQKTVFDSDLHDIIGYAILCIKWLAYSMSESYTT